MWLRRVPLSFSDHGWNGTRLSLAEAIDSFFKQILGLHTCSYVLLRPWPFAACIFFVLWAVPGHFL